MAGVVIPFLISMLIGRTIDLTTYNIGGDIYDHADYEETSLHMHNSTYTVLQDNVLPYSLIGLPADLVLRIKSNSLSSSSGALGLDGLLRETSWKSNSVVIAVTSMVQTVYRELKDDAALLSNWTRRVDRSQTHYAHSLMYGGWSVVIYRFKCDVPGDDEVVRRILTSVMGVSGEMDEHAVELWNKAVSSLDNNEDLNGNVSVHVHMYSNVHHSDDVSTPEKLLAAINKFPGEVGHLGKPVFIELKPLHNLDRRYPAIKPDHQLDMDLEKLDEMFDDLRDTKINLRKWMIETQAEFTEEEEKKISTLFEHVSRCSHLFHRIASEASIYKQMNANFIKSGFALYSRRLTPEAHSYKQLFRLLKEDIDGECEAEFVHRIEGVLAVPHHEKLEMGTVSGGLEVCKTLCIEEVKCRAIGYAEEFPVLMRGNRDPKTKIATFKVVRKQKQCWIYLRSSSTAKVISSKGHGTTFIYDRKCH